jgi:hypothetical protein
MTAYWGVFTDPPVRRGGGGEPGAGGGGGCAAPTLPGPHRVPAQDRQAWLPHNSLYKEHNTLQ